MYHQFNIQQFYLLPTQCIYVFCVDLRKDSHYFLYNINWLVFITQMQCVYCAVRTGVLNVTKRMLISTAEQQRHANLQSLHVNICGPDIIANLVCIQRHIYARIQVQLKQYIITDLACLRVPSTADISAYHKRAACAFVCKRKLQFTGCCGTLHQATERHLYFGTK